MRCLENPTVMYTNHDFFPRLTTRQSSTRSTKGHPMGCGVKFPKVIMRSPQGHFKVILYVFIIQKRAIFVCVICVEHNVWIWIWIYFTWPLRMQSDYNKQATRGPTALSHLRGTRQCG